MQEQIAEAEKLAASRAEAPRKVQQLEEEMKKLEKQHQKEIRERDQKIAEYSWVDLKEVETMRKDNKALKKTVLEMKQTEKDLKNALAVPPPSAGAVAEAQNKHIANTATECALDCLQGMMHEVVLEGAMNDIEETLLSGRPLTRDTFSQIRWDHH